MSIIITEQLKTLASFILKEATPLKYLEAKEKTFSSLKQLRRSGSLKRLHRYGGKGKFNINHGVRKYYGAGATRAQKLSSTLGRIRKRKGFKPAKTSRGVRDHKDRVTRSPRNEELETQNDCYIFDVLHYEDFQIIQEASALCAVISQQARLLDLEETYVDRGEVANVLIESLCELIQAVIQREGSTVSVSAEAMETIMEALYDGELDETKDLSEQFFSSPPPPLTEEVEEIV